MAERKRKQRFDPGSLDWLRAPKVPDVSSGAVHRMGLVETLSRKAVPGPNSPSRSEAAAMLHSLYGAALVSFTIRARGVEEALAHNYVQEYFVQVVGDPTLLAGYDRAQGPFGEYLLRSFCIHLHEMHRDTKREMPVPPSMRVNPIQVASVDDNSTPRKLDDRERPRTLNEPTPEEHLMFKREHCEDITKKVFAKVRKNMSEAGDTVGPFLLDGLLQAKNPMRPGVRELAERAGVSERTVSSRLSEIKDGLLHELGDILVSSGGTVAEGSLPEDLIRKFMDALRRD